METEKKIGVVGAGDRCIMFRKHHQTQKRISDYTELQSASETPDIPPETSDGNDVPLGS